jgi:lipid II:glycine glycyltransferase (peptidoglycan interpeptide bridge formation enzyme)
MRLPPHVFHSPPFEELDFALRFHRFSIVCSELSHWIALQGDDDEAVLASLESRGRRAVRKALKAGLEHGESDDIDQYWEILDDNLRRRFGKSPTHSRDELHRLRELCPGEVRLFTAHRGDRILGGALVMITNAETAHTFYHASREEAQELRPLNLAIYSAMVVLGKHGTRRLNLGVSTPDGQSVNWGLVSFKESFNAVGTCRDTYEIVLAGAGREGR